MQLTFLPLTVLLFLLHFCYSVASVTKIQIFQPNFQKESER